MARRSKGSVGRGLVPRRTGVFQRATRETRVEVAVTLDGEGRADVRVPVPFLGHMLEQIARHSGFDLKVRAAGDTAVDAHHTVEDVAIALGKALKEGLGRKEGIARFGEATIPLDEALVQVVVDLSGRPFFAPRGEFPRPPARSEVVAGMDGSLVEHFFQSLAVNLAASMHLRVLEGKNFHHTAEAAFKALARALRGAARREAGGGAAVPSTKGSL